MRVLNTAGSNKEFQTSIGSYVVYLPIYSQRSFRPRCVSSPAERRGTSREVVVSTANTSVPDYFTRSLRGMDGFLWRFPLILWGLRTILV